MARNLNKISDSSIKIPKKLPLSQQSKLVGIDHLQTEIESQKLGEEPIFPSTDIDLFNITTERHRLVVEIVKNMVLGSDLNIN